MSVSGSGEQVPAKAPADAPGAGFALAGLLATRVVPPGPPHPHAPQPQHLFRHQAGGIP
jgi:hypothetical protein